MTPSHYLHVTLFRTFYILGKFERWQLHPLSGNYGYRGNWQKMFAHLLLLHYDYNSSLLADIIVLVKVGNGVCFERWLEDSTLLNIHGPPVGNFKHFESLSNSGQQCRLLWDLAPLPVLRCCCCCCCCGCVLCWCEVWSWCQRKNFLTAS